MRASERASSYYIGRFLLFYLPVSELSTESIYFFHVLNLSKGLTSQRPGLKENSGHTHEQPLSSGSLPMASCSEPGLRLLPGVARSLQEVSLPLPGRLRTHSDVFGLGEEEGGPSPRESRMASQTFDHQKWALCLSQIFQAWSSDRVLYLKQASCP